MNDSFCAAAVAVSIMPSRDLVDNTWHSQMTVRFDQVGSPLEAKVLALTYGLNSLMLVTLDSIHIEQDMADVLRQAIADSIAISVRDIVICCTHSHSTPFFEDSSGTNPYFEQVKAATLGAAHRAWTGRVPARFGFACTHVVGASFNQRVHLKNGGVKFTRDYREGMASGRPIDPRLSIMRIDDARGKPIAGWVRFAAHPACVIFDAPISAEYPGYMTQKLSQSVAEGAPILFGFGAAGDVNCVPMFGTESDTRWLGENLAEHIAPVFERIKTHEPKRLRADNHMLELPLDRPPSLEVLEQEKAEVLAFVRGLDNDPDLIWLLGVNCWKDWSVQKKKAYAAPLLNWIERTKEACEQGQSFPPTWQVPISAWVIDDLGLLFYAGEPFTQIGLEIAARSPLRETLVLSHANGSSGYLGTDEDRRRGGYETYLWPRFARSDVKQRPLSYAMGAASVMIEESLTLLERLI